MVGALLALQWKLAAQAPAPAPAKRPLTYDVVDAWRSIQGRACRGTDSGSPTPLPPNRIASLAATAAPEKVVLLDKAFGGVMKAEKADTVVFTLSRFEEFPDLWISDPTFREMKKVSNANPQQAEFVWGRSALIDYVNADGKTLRAILTNPTTSIPRRRIRSWSTSDDNAA